MKPINNSLSHSSETKEFKRESSVPTKSITALPTNKSSHLQKKFSSFLRGDVVRMNYNTVDNTLTYTKIRGDERQVFTTKIEDIEKKLHLRPYVSMQSVGDCVEILPNED
jgi:hypothetical protein